MASRLLSTIPALKRFSSTSAQALHVPIPAESFPSGYLLTGVHSGIKKAKPGAAPNDLAVIVSTSSRPTSAAACFTNNVFKAAPVVVSEEVLVKNGGRARAIVVNSGCANAVTGAKGLENAWKMAKATDALLAPPSSQSSETLVMSTGVIGQHLPIDSILAAISSLNPVSSSLSAAFSAWERAAEAFMTTDTFPKLRARSFTIAGKTFKLAGMDKGAGMIHPSMRPAKTEFGGLHATLLGCVLTDAPVSPRSLQSALTFAVDRSFNSISVDGDMSTNDTIIALANGAAALEADEIDEETNRAAYLVFRDELTAFTQELAQLVVRDGEGATKFVAVTVKVRPCRIQSSNLLSMTTST